MRARIWILIITILALAGGYYYLMDQYGATNPSETELMWTIIGSIVFFFAISIFLPRLFFKGLYPNANQIMSNGGIKSKAKVLALQETGTTINTIYYLVRVSVEVHPEGQTAFQANFEAPISRLNIPRIGDEISVIFDPIDHTKITIDNSPVMPASAHSS
ncbi:hypothetical protein KA517_02990 [Candidatus Gracilibacteria bacterium]|nr:hypothetical protein [Candidatus Gracilibacteria bacterium]